ncbi:HD domain-containing protein [Streptomyces sp. G45]|uniref:HD domain-containing protein n=1 Tax=Streptomyces sp. G45 TaxID=3406627 RepID=UPI003C195C0C
MDADLRLMYAALRAAHYDIDTLHNAGLSQIRTRVHEAARDVPAHGTLLVYFTGHGVRVNGTDYLLPHDAVPPADGDWQEPYLDTLVPANISPWLKASRADTVLWVIDACRTELPSNDPPFGNSVDNGPPGGGFAVFMGCSAGERGGHTSEGSFFTRGLADALGPLTPERAVEDVFAKAAARAKAVAHRHGHPQNAGVRYGTNFEARTRATEICEGRPLLEAWQSAVRDTPLWKRVETRDEGGVTRFQDCLSTFVERCAHTLHLAQERLPFEDPWSDDTFPVRLVCDRLPQLLPEGARLSAVEVATLVAAPFLREAAWAQRLSQAAEIGPQCLERVPGADAHRRHYEQIGDQHARVARKIAECRARERTRDAVAVTMWLVHRWVADRLETDDEEAAQPFADTLAAALLGGTAPAQDRVAELSGLMRAAAAAIGIDEPCDAVARRAPAKVLLPGGHQLLRVRPLAALLRLAGTLSVDVRTFPEVVAEHLAVSDPVLPQEIVALVSHPKLLSWQPEGTALHLDVPCPHQAVHAALIEVTEQADQLAAQVAVLAGTLPEQEAALLTAVPTRVTDRDLRASEPGGRAAYEVPLLRFHLAQTEVRELLMGEQLYGGEPQLALRELYQNAMDACRYRAMRWAYLQSAGPAPARWSGQISLTMGEDERGRYVECRDNGVGMSAEQLKYTFTRAGSRFEQSKAFRREQSRWLRHDPALRLFPNSRFGIGVFSYFMLADEMAIVTRQVSPEGIPAPEALSVEIPSSGSLFRIKRHDGAGDALAEGGTRVRLYLRPGPVADQLSCVRVLRGLVRVSEFELTVRDLTGPGHTWDEGRLQPPLTGDFTYVREAVPGVLWWVGEGGGILCDGIATDQERFGYVLNLTGAHAGQLSVNRKELQDYDRQWEEDNWRAGAAALGADPDLRMEWLWTVEQSNVVLARTLWDEWRGKGITAARGESRHSLDSQGWFYLDAQILDLGVPAVSWAEQLGPWRKAALGLAHPTPEASLPQELTGYAVPHPGDADLFDSGGPAWWHVVAQAARQRTTVADVLRRQRQLRIAHKHHGAPSVWPGDLDVVPDAFDRAVAGVFAGHRQDGSMVSTASSGSVGLAAGRIVMASCQEGEPLGRVAAWYRRWTPLHNAPLPPVPDHHADYVCTAEDIACLFFETGPSYNRRFVPVTTPWHLRDACERLGVTPEELLRRIAPFGWLGWPLPRPEAVRAWAGVESDLYGVLIDFMTGPATAKALPWAATVALAARTRTTLADAEARLARAATATGLAFVRRYADGAPGGGVTPPEATLALVSALHEGEAPLEGGLGFEALGRAAAADDALSPEGLAEVVAGLRKAGVRVPEPPDVVVEWPRLPLRTRFVLSGKDITNRDEDSPSDRLTAAGLTYVAERLHESLGEVWHLAAENADRFGYTVPPPPEPLASFRPTSHDIAALAEQPYNGHFSSAEWQVLTPSALARYAATLEIDTASAYARLARLRPLGALVPELPPEAVAALPTAVPTERDLTALSHQHRLSDDDQPLTALDLVSIAGRLGEPLPVTLRRVAPYLALLPDAAPLPAPPDTVPRWQDLALLTVHLDGRLPALSGTVSAGHVARAAHGVGESTAWVTERLRLYAPFFGLALDLDGTP